MTSLLTESFDLNSPQKCSRMVAPSPASTHHRQAKRTVAPFHGNNLQDPPRTTPNPSKNHHGWAQHTSHPDDIDHHLQKDGDCLKLYSRCDRIDNTVTFIEVAGGLCPQMLQNPIEFARNLSSRGRDWTPFKGVTCKNGTQFCPLTPQNGCLPVKANCSSGLRMERKDEEFEEEENEEKSNDGEDGEEGGEDEEEEDGESQTPWKERCLESFCPLLASCSPKKVCSIRHLTAWLGRNNSKLSLFNESCPPETRFCLAEGRCTLVNETCHDLREDFNGSCNSSEKFCYSKLRCISKAVDCPSSKFPRALRDAVLARNPGTQFIALFPVFSFLPPCEEV